MLFTGQQPANPGTEVPYETAQTVQVQRTVSTIQIAVDADVPYSAAEIDLGRDYRPAIEISDIYWEQLEFARAVVTGVLGWSRTELGQWGLGLADEPPTLLEFSRIADVDARAFYPMSLGEMNQATFTPETAIPMSEQLLVELLRGKFRDEPPIADSLLGDARYFASHHPPDWSRALLTAAIATEVRVKRTLRQVPDAELQPLIGLLLTSPRGFSVAVRALFHEVMEATVGVSLNRENRDLYREVIFLFEARNRLAHSGERPTEDDARRAVAAAVAAFQWLDSLEERPTADATDTA